jgi:hypothetical protein
MKSSPCCHRATTAQPTISVRSRQDNAREAADRESQITRSLTSTSPHFGQSRCSKDSSTSSETPNPGSPFTPRRSLVRRSNSQAASEVSPALSDILRSIPTRHGPQSWRQKRCRSARIIVYPSNNRWRPLQPAGVAVLLLPSTPSAKVSKGGQRDNDDNDDPEPGRHSGPFVRGVPTLRRAGR